MAYYFNKTIKMSFDETIEKTIEELKKEGFGILTQIDVKEAMKQKLGIDFRNYRILGACNPPFARQALQIEDKIGTMLPCNVIVQELANGDVEVAAVDPVSSMQAVNNIELGKIALEIQEKLQRVINSIKPPITFLERK